jgi:hypothetical protein
MTTLVWLIIIAAILTAIVRLGLSIRRHESQTPHDNRPARGDRHPLDLMS